ncbi:unnamed protein product [Arctogadus glacialis]
MVHRLRLGLRRVRASVEALPLAPQLRCGGLRDLTVVWKHPRAPIGLSTLCMRGQILMSPITGELRLGPLIDNDDMFHHVACRALTERGRGSDGVCTPLSSTRGGPRGFSPPGKVYVSGRTMSTSPSQ